MAYVRVKPWEPACVVAHPVTGQFVNPDRAALYDERDPFVQAHRWLFATDAEIAEAVTGNQIVTEVAIPGAPENETESKPRKRA